MALFPQIGAMGHFKIKAPFNTLVSSDVVYTCIAVRRFHDLHKQGIDPFAQYYSPRGLTNAVYQTDDANGEAIVTLSDAAGQVYRIPSSFIEEFPTLGGYPYAVMGLTVSIGSMYNQTDMAPIIAAVRDAVKTYAGIDPIGGITPIALSGVTYVSSEAHNAIVANRQQTIDFANTPSAELNRLRSSYAVALDRIAELEQYIALNL